MTPPTPSPPSPLHRDKNNSALRRMVDKSKHLLWLDLFDGLLDNAGENLRAEFRLDGTHLGPSYVRLLEKALGDVWVEARGKAAK